MGVREVRAWAVECDHCDSAPLNACMTRDGADTMARLGYVECRDGTLMCWDCTRNLWYATCRHEWWDLLLDRPVTNVSRARMCRSCYLVERLPGPVWPARTDT